MKVALKTIRIYYPHALNKEDLPKTVMALGFFDGVHLGHQKVIMTAKNYAEANKLTSAVMTFDPHPSVVLAKDEKKIAYITPLEEKKKQIQKLGIDVLYVVSFNKDFSQLSPQQFVDQYIIGLHVIHVVAGFDFTFGKFGKGTMETMPFLSRNEFTQTIVEKLELNHEKISSTLIRSKIANGNMLELKQYLGRYYSVSGMVVDGEKRGRTIGFPTANIQLIAQGIAPSTGVYAVRMKVKSAWHQGVCNIGYKPTFHQSLIEPTIEVHLFDFHETIYGEHVEIEWHKKIRSEQKFSGISQLVEQIKCDKEAAEAYFCQIS